MSYVLDKPCVAGRFTVAIVSRQVVAGRAIGRHAAALHGTKVPVYAFVWDGQGRAVLDIAGAQGAPAQITTLSPVVKALLDAFDSEHSL